MQVTSWKRICEAEFTEVGAYVMPVVTLRLFFVLVNSTAKANHSPRMKQPKFQLWAFDTVNAYREN